MPQDWFSQFEKKKEEPKQEDWFSQFEKKPTEEPKLYSFLDRLTQTPNAAAEGLKQIWEWGNTPISPIPGKIASIVAPFVAPSYSAEDAKRKSELASGFWGGMATPINLGFTAATGGEYAAARAGLGGLTRGLNALSRVASVPVAAEGAVNIAQNEGLLDKGLGVLELGAGLAGMQAKPFNIRRPNLPEPNKPVEPRPLLYDAQGKIIGSDLPEFKLQRDTDIRLTDVPREDIIEAKAEGGGVKIGADVGPLAKVLGSSLYQGDISKIVTKELAQNALDAVRPLGPRGIVNVILNENNKVITVADNGQGLTKAELETVFTDLGASGKRADESAIGGFGLAKAAPLLGGEKVEVVTVAIDQGVKMRHSFTGTPDELIQGVKINSEIVPNNTPTGTTVTTHVGKDTYMYKAVEQIKSTIDNSPALESQINLFKSYSDGVPVPIKQKPAGKMRLEDFDIETIQSPVADIEIMIPKTAKYAERPIQLQLLNQGMFQNSSYVDFQNYPGIPDRILINIKSRVPEGHVDYPFTANRESLRGTVNDLVIKTVEDRIIKPAVGRRVGQLQQVYSSMPEMPITSGNKFHIYDVGQRFTPDELQAFISDPFVIRLSDKIDEITRDALAILRDIPELKKIEKLGLILDETVHGIYIPNPGKEQAAILFNPFISLSKGNPDTAATSLIHTILHEIAHAKIGKHNEDFTVALHQIHEKFGASNTIKSLGEVLDAITTPGNRTQFSGEVQPILQRYNEARGRANVIEDPLRGTGVGARNKKSGGAGKVSGNAEPRRTAVIKVIKAIQDAKPIRAEQQEMYTGERIGRMREATKTRKGGEAGFYKRLGKLKGEYEKVDFESIRTKLDQPDIDSLFNAIDESVNLRFFEKINASTALAKLLGEMGGQVPARYELKMLDKVFGEGFSQAINDAGFVLNPFNEPIKLTREAVNAPRAIMASNDLSAPLRQGLGLITRKEFWTSLDDMVKAWGSENFYRATMDAIEESPDYAFARHNGLKLTDLGNYSSREEQFMSKLAEYFPLVRRSERAYLAFLNKVRFDSYNSLLRDARNAGLNPFEDLSLAKEIAGYVNNASGRGSLGQFEESALLLNSALFSPRLIASRVAMLNPATYVNASPFVRKQYLRSLLGIAGFGATALGLGKLLTDGTIESSPNSADFGKLRVGNVRLDPWGGHQQYLVAAHRLISGEVKSTTTGREYELGGRYGSPTRLDMAARFGESKLNPAWSFVTTLLRGKDFQGLPISVQKEVASRFLPIIWQDMYELAVEDPKLLPLSALTALGMGTQVYGGKTGGSNITYGNLDNRQNPNIRY